MNELVMRSHGPAATAAAAEDEVGHVVDLYQVEEEAARDEEYRLLRECVANDGWAERKDWEPLALRQYFKMRRHLSCQGTSSLHCDEKTPRGWSYLRPEACSPREPSCGAPRQGLNVAGEQSVYWPGLSGVEQEEDANVRYAIRTPPPSPAEHSCTTGPRSTIQASGG
ncbi:hypothetical protein GWK47_025261 [Chionoecetes opilio]|uniref:Uncharacterized protein n=1 Tax=Chionoecetes opilio TaxID=41210 RepID=A0A8J5CIV5_CHIOP|nr:hypothetical protein GWK47_025261 [Chionoecetes opilio]